MHIQPFGHDLDVCQQKDLQSFLSRPNSLPSCAASPSDWPRCADGTRETQAGAPPRVILAASLSRPTQDFLSFFWLMAEVFFFHLRPESMKTKNNLNCATSQCYGKKLQTIQRLIPNEHEHWPLHFFSNESLFFFLTVGFRVNIPSLKYALCAL